MTAVPLEKAIWPPTTGASKLCPTSRAASTRPAHNAPVTLTVMQGRPVPGCTAVTFKAAVRVQACSRSALHMCECVEASLYCDSAVGLPPVRSCANASCTWLGRRNLSASCGLQGVALPHTVRAA